MTAVVLLILLSWLGVPAAGAVACAAPLLRPPEFALAVVPCGDDAGTIAPWTQAASTTGGFEALRQNLRVASKLFAATVSEPPIVACEFPAPIRIGSEEAKSPVDSFESWTTDCYGLREIEESEGDPMPWHCVGATRAPIALVGRVLDCCSTDETHGECLMRIRVLEAFRGGVRPGQVVGVWQHTVETREAYANSRFVLAFLAPWHSPSGKREARKVARWARRFGIERIFRDATVRGEDTDDFLILTMNAVRPEWLAFARHPGSVAAFCGKLRR